MTELVLQSRDGPVLTLTLNLPGARNPISDQWMIDALVAALDAADCDIGVGAVILTGAGPAFSAGGNLKKMAPGGGIRDALAAETRRNYKTGIQQLPSLLAALEVPVIAAVNGPAIGAGCDLACSCDIRIAGRSASFAASFVRLGLVAGDGGAWLLPRVVGFPKACEMALTGDALDAQQALACGLVSQVVPDAELLGAAHTIAQRIAANPPHAVRMTKRLLRTGQEATLANVLEMSAAMQGLAHATPDHEEALSASLQRRRPGSKAAE